MSLWVDKYRPKKLENLSYHEGITKSLAALASTGDFPHLLVYGPPGSGKKTRIYSTLNELFGGQVEKLKIDVKTFTTSSNRKLEFNVLSSPYHLEITPSDMGNNDRVVIQDLLKDVASTEQVDFSNQAKLATKHRFKVVVINEADSLTRDAQAALRRTMEKYSSNIRLIMVCNTIANIIAPIKSRTLLVRIPAPTSDEIASILLNIAAKEALKLSLSSDDSQQYFRAIADSSDRNLRRALLSFETISMQNETIPVDRPETATINLDWEVIIRNIARSMAKEKTVANLAKLRETFYELLSHCIPARLILKTLALELMGTLDSERAKALIEIASVFDERLSLGQKLIFHLEGFAAKAMVAMS